MYWIAVPIITFAIKKYISSEVACFIDNRVSEGISEGINKGVKEAENKVLSSVYKGLHEAFVSTSINVALLLVAVYFVPAVADKSVSIFIIANVYLASVVHGLFNVYKRIPVVYKMISGYGLDIKSYIRDEIYKIAYLEAYSRASREIEENREKIPAFLRLVFDVDLGDPKEIAHKVASPTSMLASNIIVKELVKKVSVVVVFVVVYYVLFRFVVAPFLLQDIAGMGVVDILIYPFLFSVNYFITL